MVGLLSPKDVEMVGLLSPSACKGITCKVVCPRLGVLVPASDLFTVLILLGC